MSLDWIDETRELGVGGRATTRRASAEECNSIAAALGILACDNLVFDYTLKPIADGRYRIKGTLKADVTQECVVSLEPVPATIDEEVVVEFWPPHLLAERRVDGEHAILGETDPEPIGQLGRFETGRIAFEIFQRRSILILAKRVPSSNMAIRRTTARPRESIHSRLWPSSSCKNPRVHDATGLKRASVD